jgi:hypothetical protein
MQPEADVDGEDESSWLVVEPKGRVPPLHHGVYRSLVQRFDRAEHPDLLDLASFVNGRLYDDRPLDPRRHRIWRIGRLDTVDELWSLHTCAHTNWFDPRLGHPGPEANAAFDTKP